ncbi:MAG: OprD family outer membrane porin [Bacteroidia bacterium]
MHFLKYSAFLLVFLAVQGLAAQGVHPYLHHNERDRDSTEAAETLQQFFRNGTLFGHARYFFMHTDNAPGLSDYFANAFGMGIAYESAPYKGFQLGLSGFFNYNLYSSPLDQPDPRTGQMNRYEIGIFDIERPAETRDMDRLEDLYLKYTYRKTQFVFGKQHVKTPFINPQDGRMRPTLVEGLQFRLQEWEKLEVQGGLLYNLSPRSTVRWFRIGESIGVYPKGQNTLGEPAFYKGKISSDYLGFIGFRYKPIPNLELQLWDMYVDQLMNNVLLQADYSFATNRIRWRIGAQAILQDGVGGNALSHDYLLPNHQARVYGVRLGFDLPSSWQFTANYTRIADRHRYLMPREWGRDPMFTFLPRERNEGFADVHAASLVIKKQLSSRWIVSSGTGYYRLPDPADAFRNKYAMPAYYQINLDALYNFGGLFEGLSGQILYVYKGPTGATPKNERWVFNKVNMSLLNVVLNYHF